MILCVIDGGSANNTLPATLHQAGYEVLTTSSAAQATALLFLHRKLEAVVIDQRENCQLAHGLARLMRSLRADVPMLLLARETVEPLPRWFDACLCVGQELSSVLPVLNTLVGGHRSLNLDVCGIDEVSTARF